MMSMFCKVEKQGWLKWLFNLNSRTFDEYYCWHFIHNHLNGKILVIRNPINSDDKTSLTGIINEVTSCKVRNDGDIEFKTLPIYNQNLILLSFIRNLWFEPFLGYSKKFFENLKKVDFVPSLKDPIQKLTWANKQACNEFKSAYSPGHSNVHKGLKIKTLKQFLAIDSNTTTQDFLCT